MNMCPILQFLHILSPTVYITLNLEGFYCNIEESKGCSLQKLKLESRDDKRAESIQNGST